MSTIKSKPMLFSGEMVRALLEGRKTQTRRILEVPTGWSLESPSGNQCVLGTITSSHPKQGRFGAFIQTKPRGDEPIMRDLMPCPYGAPGNLLWVREAYADIGVRLTYAADADDGAHCQVKRWTPSIHMYRAHSRLTLEITGVRVERIKDISHGDAISEGVAVFNEDDANLYYSGVSFNPGSWFEEPHKWHLDGPREAFFELWDSINFDRGAGVATNPWVWVIEFTVHHCNVDALIKQREAA